MMSEGVAFLGLVPVVLALTSFLALVIGWRRKERAGVRRVLLTVAVCATLAPPCWLISSALRAREQQAWFDRRFGGEERKLLAKKRIDIGLEDRFDREGLIGGAPYAWFPAVAAIVLGLRLRLLQSGQKPSGKVTADGVEQ